jgi:hypothetical protein
MAIGFSWLLGKRLDGMAGDEPGRLDAEAFEQLQEPHAADLAGEEAARNVVGRILAAIRAEPAGHRIDVDAEAAQDFLSHCPSPYFFSSISTKANS